MMADSDCFIPKDDFEVAFVAFVETLESKIGRRLYFDITRYFGSHDDFVIPLGDRFIAVSNQKYVYGVVELHGMSTLKYTGNVNNKIDSSNKIVSFVKKSSKYPHLAAL